MSELYFQDKDKFLVNRDNLSGYMEAKTIKNIVNPIGNVEQPKILDPIENQGFPVKSSPIILTSGTYGDPTITLTLENLDGLDILGGDGETINEPIESTGTYTPITTSINKVTSLGGNQYKLFFDVINYDISLFEDNEQLHFVGQSVDACKLVSRSNLDQSMTVQSTSNLVDSVGEKLESSRNIKGTAVLVKYYTHDINEQDFRCDIIDANNSGSLWLSTPYNNRRQRMTFDTLYPIGGEYVDIKSSRFKAEPFVCDNEVLQLTDVFWRLNGTEFKVPVVNKNDFQYWDVPESAMIEDQINTVTVVYKAGQNSSLDIQNPNTVKFIPKTITSRSNLIDDVNSLDVQVTELGL